MRLGGANFGLLQRVDGRPVADVVEDVVQHLGHLLNVKQKYGSFLPTLGLAISDLMWSKRPMLDLAAHIREQIVLYEPRLRNPRVTPGQADEQLCPTFRILGRIGDSDVRLLLSLHTVYCSVHVTQE